MKNVTTAILLACCLAIINGCTNDNDDLLIVNNHSFNSKDLMRFREIAWNHLSQGEKDSVIKDWRIAIVKVEKYDKKDAVAVLFNTDDDPLLGPIAVYIDPDTQKVLGYGLRL